MVLQTLGNTKSEVLYQVMALDFGELDMGMKLRHGTKSEVISGETFIF